MFATLQHPGPAVAPRFRVSPCTAQPVALMLPARDSLLASLAEALADFDGAWLEITDASMARLDFVIPGPDPAGRHAAWYAGPHQMGQGARILRAGIHLGWRDGLRFAHGHGHFVAPGWSAPGMGHILPQVSALAAPVLVRGWGWQGARLVVQDDPETGFALFQPQGGAGGGTAWLVTLRPGQDISAGLAAALPGVTGRVLGLGSLVDPVLDGRRIDSFATEILLTDGALTPQGAHLSADLVTLAGTTHSGTLTPGRNGICVTAELLVLA